MASAFTHAFVALAAGKIYTPRSMDRRFWITSVALSILPDLDVVGFQFGIRYQDLLGHRGFSHSIVFAFLAGAAVLPLFPDRSWKLWLYFSIVTASHGFLDAMTDGGLGIAFFSPLVGTRYFFPWRPIPVSPIGVREFFDEHGLSVLFGEVAYVWIPLGVLTGGYAWLRNRRAKKESPETRADERRGNGSALP